MADSGVAAPAQTAGYHVVTRGVHHLALTTEDMKATTEFFVNVVGMPLVHAMKVPEGVGTGPGNRGNPPWNASATISSTWGTTALLAFFEIPQGRKAAIRPRRHRRHAALRLRGDSRAVRGDPAAADPPRRPFDGPIDILPGMVSVYFRDPNGIRLEACCHPDEGEGRG